MNTEKNRNDTQRKRWIAAAAVVAAIAAVAVMICLAGGPLAAALPEPEQIRSWIRRHKLAGRLGYVGAVMLQVVLAVIPGEPLEIAGGYLFGALEGTLLCLGAAAVGSVIVFFLVRRFGVGFARVFFSSEKLRSLRFLQSSPRRVLLFMAIFMIPGTPKDLLCYYAGLTDIKLPVFLIVCSLGRIPALVSSTLGGDALGMESYVRALVVFAVTLAISGTGLLIYDRICKKHDVADGRRQEEMDEVS